MSRSKMGWLVILIAAILSIVVLVVNISAAYSGKSLFKKPEKFEEVEEANFEPVVEEPVSQAEGEAIASEGEVEAIADENDVSEGVVETELSEVEAEVVQDEIVWHFYNLDLQDDGDKLNDYNFGPNPILENISLEKVKEAIRGKKASDTVKVEELVELLDTERLKEDQIMRMHDDPKLGAADMAWMDSITGTRYLGTFYSAAKEQWDVAMNEAADAWILDEESYYQTLTAFEKWLNSATSVRIEYRDSGLTDQMYMNPYTPSGIPDIIVMETDNHEGWFIVYTFTIKGTKTLEVAYRIDCGYQPTNVAKVMKVKVNKNPNNQTGGSDAKKITNKSTNGTSTTPGGDPGGDDPGGDDPGGDDPKPKKKQKDPTKGTSVEKNDDPGPGEDTNTGKDSETSSKEEDSNSNNMSQEEYQKAIDELKDANDAKAGNDNPPVEPENTDDNSENGNGNGGIDKPTEVQDSSVADDDAGGAWDGPPD